MSSYGLTCEFPVEELVALSDLESLDLSANFDLTVGCFPTAMLVSLEAVQHCRRHPSAHQGLMSPSCCLAVGAMAWGQAASAARRLAMSTQCCRDSARMHIQTGVLLPSSGLTCAQQMRETERGGATTS
jgi:hypothetical protein